MRIHTRMTGISRGTESLVFRGLVPESERDRMRCPFQEGAFPFPVKYGYAAVGEVADGPRERIGQAVLCLHPHQTRFTVPGIEAIPIPAGIPFHRAVLAPQMETALNATWDAGIRIGDRIAVVGAGSIGCLVAYLCARMPGCDTMLVDVNLARRPVADALGVRFALPEQGEPETCDVVFHASGTPDGLAGSLSLAGFEARVVELSWFGASSVLVPLGGPFHSRRLQLLSSQVGAVAPSRRARWSHLRRLSLALLLTAAPELDALIQEDTPFDALPGALPAILGRTGALLHRVTYQQD